MRIPILPYFKKRYIFLIIFLVIFYYSLNFYLDQPYIIDDQEWILKQVIETNINVLAKMGNRNDSGNFEKIVKFADATRLFVRMPDALTTVCYTDWGIVWRVLFYVVIGPNSGHMPWQEEFVRYYGTDEIRKDLKLDKNMTGETFIFAKKDPLERVVDEYMRTCIEDRHPCFGCGYDFVCHLQKVHLHLKIVGADNSTMHPDYVRYIPLNWFCEMKTMKDRFIILDENQVKERVFDKEYSHVMALGRNEKDKKYWKHSIKMKSLFIDMILSNQYLYDLFMACYHWDYVIFNYKKPTLKEY